VTKLDASGSSLVYSTFLGGALGEVGSGLALDGSGGAVVTGPTGSADFPTTSDAFDVTLDGATDAFVSRIDPAGAALTCSTYQGGSATDFSTGVATTSSPSAWIVGSTTSEDFPTTPRAFDKRINGKGTFDAFFSEVTVQ
jgi:hypothetical protein